MVFLTLCFYLNLFYSQVDTGIGEVVHCLLCLVVNNCTSWIGSLCQVVDRSSNRQIDILISGSGSLIRSIVLKEPATGL